MSRALRVFHGSFGRVALLDMDRPLVPHAHHHCHVLLKSYGADTAFNVDNRPAPLTDETAVLVNPWELHSYDHRDQAPQTVILALYIEPDWLSAAGGMLAGTRSRRFFSQPCIAINARIQQQIRAMTDLMLLEVEVAQPVVEAMIFNLMQGVVERFAQRFNLHALNGPGGLAVRDRRIGRAVAYLRDGMQDRCTLDDVARQSGLSRPHFFLLFRRETGLTPHVYLNMMRMERAIGALSISSSSVVDVGQSVGFDMPGNFTRFFRQHQGASPRDYRRAVDLVGTERRSFT